ncbi:hypothetical protein ABH945_005723 [Paraburkholderia sp. GAS333]|uniref:hypothetical protein n=1 Tax=Paraburkholderia sp. GAS333 TaxID=3156279 RepID=UPI003D1FB6DF
MSIVEPAGAEYDPGVTIASCSQSHVVVRLGIPWFGAVITKFAKAVVAINPNTPKSAQSTLDFFTNFSNFLYVKMHPIFNTKCFINYLKITCWPDFTYFA